MTMKRLTMPLNGNLPTPEEMDLMAQAPSDPRVARQDGLNTVPNPIRGRDSLTRIIGASPDGTEVELVYVADKWLLEVDTLKVYLSSAQGQSVHALAAMMLDDFNNVLVPKFLQVRAQDGDASVLLEERRPRWDNPALLSRLTRF